MRALTLQLKWSLLRYGPVELRIWTDITRLYQAAEKRGFIDSTIEVYPGSRGNGTVKAEFLKALMLWASSTDGLSPMRQEVAERLVAHLSRHASMMQFAGVGNVGGTILTALAQRQAVSSAGTLGHQARTFREYTYPWTLEAMLVLFTDGLSTHWAVQDIPKLRQHHPSVIAAALYRDYSRQRDDVTVVVMKEAA